MINIKIRGPQGEGKTTVMNLIAKVLSETGARVYTLEEDAPPPIGFRGKEQDALDQKHAQFFLETETTESGRFYDAAIVVLNPGDVPLLQRILGNRFKVFSWTQSKMGYRYHDLIFVGCKETRSEERVRVVHDNFALGLSSPNGRIIWL